MTFTREQLTQAINNITEELKNGVLKEQALIGLIDKADAGYIGLSEQEYNKAVNDLETIQAENEKLYKWLNDFQKRLASLS